MGPEVSTLTLGGRPHRGLISHETEPTVSDAAMSVAEMNAFHGGEAQKQALMGIVQTNRLLWQLLQDRKERFDRRLAA